MLTRLCIFIILFVAQATQKAMLSSWSKLYKVFACCSALVATAEENICCEELCVKMNAVIDKEALLASMRAIPLLV